MVTLLVMEWPRRRNIHTNDTLHIITVIEEVHPDLPNTEYFNNMAKSINAELHTKGEARLQAYAQQAKEHGVSASSQCTMRASETRCN